MLCSVECWHHTVKSCSVSIDAFTKCHTVTHQALDQNSALPTSPPQWRQICRSQGCDTVWFDEYLKKNLCTFSCVETMRGSGCSLHFHWVFLGLKRYSGWFTFSTYCKAPGSWRFSVNNLLAVSMMWQHLQGFSAQSNISVPTHHHIWHKLSQCTCCHVVT